jgi:hypothetical protein
MNYICCHSENHAYTVRREKYHVNATFISRYHDETLMTLVYVATSILQHVPIATPLVRLNGTHDGLYIDVGRKLWMDPAPVW